MTIDNKTQYSIDALTSVGLMDAIKGGDKQFHCPAGVIAITRNGDTVTLTMKQAFRRY